MSAFSILLLLAVVTGGCALSVVDVGTFSAAKNLPFENKDAFFACPPHFYGVFDGVSQCPQSRAFAQTLAKGSCTRLQGATPGGSMLEQVQPVLWQALGEAQGFSGCSTACLLRLDLQQEQPQVSVYNLGDCTCMVLREVEGGAMEISGISEEKLHSSGAPYQLGGEKWKTDRIEEAAMFAFDVAEGSIVLAFSDGISSNLEAAEICQIASAPQPAALLARNLVEMARQRNKVQLFFI
jgi:serine/threonine protein phosphatase PrpC